MKPFTNLQVLLCTIIVPVFIWFFYNGLLIGNYNKFRQGSNDHHYFKNLSISFLDGSTSLTQCPKNSDCHDLVLYKDKIYLYWPPAPAILYIPFVLIWGENTPDHVILSLIGAFNILLLSLLIRQFAKNYSIPISPSIMIAASIFWGLGTVHFYMSMTSSVWFYSQILAQTFLLGSILFFLKELSLKNLIISGILFGLACYTRNNLIFSFFFFIAVYFSLHHKGRIISTIKHGAIFGAPMLVFSVGNLFYNYSRFGNPLENGLQFHKMSDYFAENFKNHGYFSPHYIPYNFFTEVIAPPVFSSDYPYFSFNPVGFGLFWVSPLFLLILPLGLIYIKKIVRQNSQKSIHLINQIDLITITGIFLSLFFIALIIFMIMGNGWYQFGARYTLDFQIFLLLPILFLFKLFPSNSYLSWCYYFFIVLSIYVNYNGVKMFHAIP